MQLGNAIGAEGDRGVKQLLADFAEDRVRDAWGRAATSASGSSRVRRGRRSPNGYGSPVTFPRQWPQTSSTSGKRSARGCRSPPDPDEAGGEQRA